ncbi:MAG: Hsp20/alpha crystallin family protein [Thermoleophilia bacterium]
MSSGRWRHADPFRELEPLQRLVRGLLDHEAGADDTWRPAVDAWQDGEDVVYAFDLPGVREDDIEVDLDEGALTVTARRESTIEQQRGQLFRRERRVGTFVRTVPVPRGVAEDAIRASYARGVLEVRVPQAARAGRRRIPVGTPGRAPVAPGSTEGQGAGGTVVEPLGEARAADEAERARRDPALPPTDEPATGPASTEAQGPGGTHVERLAEAAAGAHLVGVRPGEPGAGAG